MHSKATLVSCPAAKGTHNGMHPDGKNPNVAEDADTTDEPKTGLGADGTPAQPVEDAEDAVRASGYEVKEAFGQ